ncbi:TetR/AcrR family transcriptional regulator [Leucobacter sp.]
MTEQIATANGGRRTGGRARLSRERIIASAQELAARPGVDGLSIRDLGRELGVDPSAIYRHFTSKNDLMTALVDAQAVETLARVDTDPARDWRDVLTDIAEVGLEIRLRYPVIGADAAAILTESTDIIEAILAAFSRGGLRDDRLVEFYTLYASYVLSFSGSIARSRIEYGEEQADRAWAEDVRVASDDTHPTASRHRERILALGDVEVYRVGVRLILEAAAAAARSDAA